VSKETFHKWQQTYARTAGETKCCIEETAQLNLQQKNVRAEKLKV